MIEVRCFTENACAGCPVAYLGETPEEQEALRQAIQEYIPPAFHVPILEGPGAEKMIMPDVVEEANESDLGLVVTLMAIIAAGMHADGRCSRQGNQTTRILKQHNLTEGEE
jgi:hypothetical protein